MKKKTETTTAGTAAPKTTAKVPSKPRGRPLSFDRDAALERAMHVFWEHGYEAASINELTSAMGITPPSLYTAFGDKERLFLEAIERYGKGPGGFGRRALAEEPTARRAIQRLLEEAAAELTQSCHPLGCMMVMATANCSVAAEHVQAALAKRRALGVGTMQARLQRGIDEGELPASTDAGALANFYATVYQGMSMQAKDGASRASLLGSVEMAMRSWPESQPSPRRLKSARRATA
jgi:TetR/AcrR family transcriptional regulator, copper-responsive repressor